MTGLSSFTPDREQIASEKYSRSRVFNIRHTEVGMKITAVNTAVVEANFDWTFVRVYTERDTYGTGECFFAPGLTAAIADIAEVIIGQDPRNIDYLTHLMRRATSCSGASGGTVHHAITGIEFALWDLLGKVLEVPVWQMLGGKWRDSVRLYADSHAGTTLESMGPCTLPRNPKWNVVGNGDGGPDDVFTPAAYASMARKVLSRGFTAIKFDIDIFNGQHQCETRPLSASEVARQVELATAVRDAVGADVDLAIDCHWRYNFNDVLKIARGCEPLGLMWLEDPMPPENTDNLFMLARQTSTPICTGENAYLVHGFRKIVETNACHIIAPDFQKAGGVLEAKRIADYAQSYYVPIAPHCIASPVGTIQSAHLCATMPNFLALEFHAQDVPFWEVIGDRKSKPVIVSGHILIDDEPGFGVELNEEVARQYARPDEPFFFDSPKP